MEDGPISQDLLRHILGEHGSLDPFGTYALDDKGGREAEEEEPYFDRDEDLEGYLSGSCLSLPEHLESLGPFGMTGLSDNSADIKKGIGGVLLMERRMLYIRAEPSGDALMSVHQPCLLELPVETVTRLIEKTKEFEVNVPLTGDHDGEGEVCEESTEGRSEVLLRAASC
ncbi:hypothetical protein K504DRAFT_503984 [Pleomassaria siparia CBS 279.74]|uniref:Uncharacterized protein n=1 Tax=Pleomassaria siparia CBS 279.74 TaxID=1314801 RepID=A0A6G1K4E6_9PLEO|nr:hypothetical protein K504DRAFT_503984 [Pleomassaria siparia CBS 279.74]